MKKGFLFIIIKNFFPEKQIVLKFHRKFNNNKIMSENKQPNINIQIKDELQTGVYSNAVSVNVNNNEVVLDFGMIIPNSNPTTIKIQSRIILNQQTAESFMSILQDAMLDFRNKKAAAPQSENN